MTLPCAFQVLDDKNVRRRFRASNYQSTTRVKPFICTMPMRLDDGWNQIQFNLSDFTRRAYGTNYIETLRVQVLPDVSGSCGCMLIWTHGVTVQAAGAWVQVFLGQGGVEGRGVLSTCKVSNSLGKRSQPDPPA